MDCAALRAAGAAAGPQGVLTGILAGLAAGALWGLVFVAPRMVPGFSSVDLTAGRFAAYGAIAAASGFAGALAAILMF